MPTSFLSADAGFPRLTADVPVEERMRRITDYLYMLLENLRYTLGNLGEENFNEASLASIEREITDPIMQVVADVQGNVSVLEQTAAGLTVTVANQAGQITTLQATAQELSATVSDQAGQITTLQATAEGLTTTVANQAGQITIAQQTADKIGFIVKNYETAEAASFELTSRMASLVADEISVYGAVTFNTLDTYLATSGSTQINGNNVLLQTDRSGVSDSFLGMMNEDGYAYGAIQTRNTSSSTNPYEDNRMLVFDSFGLAGNEYVGVRIESGRGLILEAAKTLNLLAQDQIVMNCNGGHPVIIQADIAPYASYWCPSGCYSFCNDGIYYGSTKIVAV